MKDSASGRENVLKNILLVRHLPSALTNDEKKDLLQHFGAIDVHITGTKGGLKEAAFATFPDSELTSNALHRLHQLEVLGCRLVVEYARTSPETKLHPPPLNIGKKNEAKSKTDEEPIKEFDPPKDETYLKWGLHYPKNPRFQYNYPAPTVTILTNIANALAACPKFYTQVLHLMNKMNLPAPFGQPTPNPPVPTGEGSSSESELESETESTNLVPKRKKKHLKIRKDRPLKRMKLVDDFPTLSTTAVDPSNVFELDETASAQRKIQLNIPSAIPQSTEPVLIDEDDNKEEEVSQAEGFGVIEPVVKPVEGDETKDNDEECSEFISNEELRKGRMSEDERKEMNIFRKYDRGEVSCRLYIKNLSKQASEKDLRYIFGKYINWTEESEVNIYDVRLMKEGRMKGQAFVTLPSERVAEQALQETHAYILHDKPMLVQFARSAKASADPKTQDK